MEFQFLRRGQNQSTLEKTVEKRTYIKFKQNGIQFRPQCWKAFALSVTTAPSISSLHFPMLGLWALQNTLSSLLPSQNCLKLHYSGTKRRMLLG